MSPLKTMSELDSLSRVASQKMQPVFGLLPAMSPSRQGDQRRSMKSKVKSQKSKVSQEDH